MSTIAPLPEQFEVTRANVRKIAEEHHLVLQAASSRGGNSHQVALDQGDWVREITSRLPEEEARHFFALYSEELDAVTHSLLEETEILEREEQQRESAAALKQAQQTGNALKWIALIAFFAALIAWIR